VSGFHRLLLADVVLAPPGTRATVETRGDIPALDHVDGLGLGGGLGLGDILALDHVDALALGGGLGLGLGDGVDVVRGKGGIRKHHRFAAAAS